ncbi:arsenical resistance operon trans-acting repressor ArsD [Trichococcus patagoniensis]|uniref:Arsenical resistance operon trans-acting repressor ArsD n=1 Tax=Trichococcus patagoniensis TaxID=382641 RepID=A0A2T5IPJ7_9LACT|nr:arsenic metallochaperone ArsD family protein [Trichococcus patagoniensis]PTQ85754.1 arsenical resistance operon trans-acting repressor ArsD [Trichococcus patagoniensis]
MTNITIFEPETSSSLFSSQDALRIAAVIEALAELENYEALLFNLTDDAEQFESNKVVNEKIQAEGNAILPITVVDGEIVKTGAYPTNDEITGYIGVRFVESTEDGCGCGCGCGGSAEAEEKEEEQAESGCCGGKGKEGGCGCGGHGHGHGHHHHEESAQAKGGCGCGGHGHHHH